MGWAPASRVLSNWWPHAERGKAFGLYVFAAGLASAVAYLTSNAVLHAGLGWRWIFRLPVLLMLLGGSVYYVLVRDRPSDLGLSDDLNPSPIDPVDRPVYEESSFERYKAALSNWRFMLAGLAIGFQNAARYGLLVWVPVYFLGSSWSSNPLAGWITIALPIGMALGAVSSGWISDNLFSSNRSQPIMIFLLLAGVSTAALYFLGRSHPASVIPLLFLSGFFVYGPQAPFWALCPDLLGKERAGTGTGVLNTFAYGFAGLNEPLIGNIIQRHHDDVSLVFPMVAAACIIGGLLAAMIRR
jgi:OPA family glycerol-3-phosphate transporter-like MFS transporter